MGEHLVERAGLAALGVGVERAVAAVLDRYGRDLSWVGTVVVRVAGGQQREVGGGCDAAVDCRLFGEVGYDGVTPEMLTGAEVEASALAAAGGEAGLYRTIMAELLTQRSSGKGLRCSENGRMLLLAAGARAGLRDWPSRRVGGVFGGSAADRHAGADP
ncbi:hypothetical protein ABZ914_24875 [Spirillospora sp. NPDC046719]